MRRPPVFCLSQWPTANIRGKTPAPGLGMAISTGPAPPCVLLSYGTSYHMQLRGSANTQPEVTPFESKCTRTVSCATPMVIPTPCARRFRIRTSASTRAPNFSRKGRQEWRAQLVACGRGPEATCTPLMRHRHSIERNLNYGYLVVHAQHTTPSILLVETP